jgi:hypothetical protein
MKIMGRCAMQSELSHIQVFIFFIFDEPDDLPSQLEQERFPRRDVNHGKLDATNVGAGHCDLFHAINLADSLNERKIFCSCPFRRYAS